MLWKSWRAAINIVEVFVRGFSAKFRRELPRAMNFAGGKNVWPKRQNLSLNFVPHLSCFFLFCLLFSCVPSPLPSSSKTQTSLQIPLSRSDPIWSDPFIIHHYIYISFIRFVKICDVNGGGNLAKQKLQERFRSIKISGRIWLAKSIMATATNLRGFWENIHHYPYVMFLTPRTLITLGNINIPEMSKCRNIQQNFGYPMNIPTGDLSGWDGSIDCLDSKSFFCYFSNFHIHENMSSNSSMPGWICYIHPLRRAGGFLPPSPPAGGTHIWPQLLLLSPPCRASARHQSN